MAGMYRLGFYHKWKEVFRSDGAEQCAWKDRVMFSARDIHEISTT